MTTTVTWTCQCYREKTNYFFHEQEQVYWRPRFSAPGILQYVYSYTLQYTAPTVNPFKWSPIDVLTVAQVALQNFNVILLELAFLTLYSRS